MRRRRQPISRPPEPPPGFMYWHGHLWRIKDVERLCRQVIGKHDRLPRRQRDDANDDAWPDADE
jgi:hypothetical protein